MTLGTVDYRCDECNADYKNCGGGDLIQCPKNRGPNKGCGLRMVRHTDEIVAGNAETAALLSQPEITAKASWLLAEGGQSLASILSDRGKTHGDFGDNAEIALQIRDVMRSAKPHWSNLSAEQRLALEEIALKIARICSGGNWEAEHWRDIQGYAKLGENVCNSRNAAQE